MQTLTVSWNHKKSLPIHSPSNFLKRLARWSVVYWNLEVRKCIVSTLVKQARTDCWMWRNTNCYLKAFLMRKQQLMNVTHQNDTNITIVPLFCTMLGVRDAIVQITKSTEQRSFHLFLIFFPLYIIYFPVQFLIFSFFLLLYWLHLYVYLA